MYSESDCRFTRVDRCAVTLNKVNSLLRDGLKLKDIKVQKVERKASSNGKPGVIIASIETLEQSERLWKQKRL